MKLDRRALDRILALDDRQLATLVAKLAAEYRLDLSQLFGKGDVQSIRRALQNATDEDLLALVRRMKGKE